MRQTTRWAAWLAAMAAAGAVGAQGVYRCGNTYSQQPCTGGNEIQVQDPRSPGQARQTSDAARKDAHSAAVLEKERLAQEGKAAPPVVPIKVEPPLEPPAPPLNGAKVKSKKPTLFTAKVPKKPAEPKKKKPKPEAA